MGGSQQQQLSSIVSIPAVGSQQQQDAKPAIVSVQATNNSGKVVLANPAGNASVTVMSDKSFAGKQGESMVTLPMPNAQQAPLQASTVRIPQPQSDK